MANHMTNVDDEVLSDSETCSESSDINVGNQDGECDEQSKQLTDHEDNGEDNNQLLGKYECDDGECDEQSRQLTDHEDNDEDNNQLSGKYECEVCGKRLTTPFNLKVHSRVHSGEKLFECQKCLKKFTRSSNLNKHMRNVCTGREVGSTDSRQLGPEINVGEQSIHTVTGKKSFECKKCLKKFTRSSNLNAHMRNVCSKDEVGSTDKRERSPKPRTSKAGLTCDVCSKTFSKKSNLTKHMEIHFREYECKICGEKFESSSELKDHNRIHTFECKKCLKKFTRLSNLNAHMRNVSCSRNDSGEMPDLINLGSPEDECEELTEDSSSLPSTSNYAEFTCDICSKSFSKRSNLIRHMVVHTGDKPFECTKCFKKFSTSSNLSAHKCKICSRDAECTDSREMSSPNDGESEQLTEDNDPEVQLTEHNDPEVQLTEDNYRLPTVEPGKYECNLCGKGYSTPFNLKVHIDRIHSGHVKNKSFECKKCFKKKFDSSWNLKRHLKTCPGKVESTENEESGQLTKGDNKRNRRLKTGRPRGPKVEFYICSVCGKKWTNRYSCIRHVYHVHFETSFECETCGKKLKSAESLKLHNSIHTGVKPFECKKCPKKYATADRLKSHTRTCFEKVRNTLSTKEMIKRHVDADGNGTIQCEECNKRFARLCSLKLHVEHVHRDERKGLCELCGKVLRKYSLKTHLRHHHYGEKRFQCETCGQKFALANTLKKHMEIHSNDKPFTTRNRVRIHSNRDSKDKQHECKECQKKFTRLSALNYHMHLHRIQKPTHSCHICQMKFPSAGNLGNHMRTHSRETPSFSCSICSKSFFRKIDLKSHMAHCKGTSWHSSTARPAMTCSNFDSGAARPVMNWSNVDSGDARPVMNCWPNVDSEAARAVMTLLNVDSGTSRPVINWPNVDTQAARPVMNWPNVDSGAARPVINCPNVDSGAARPVINCPNVDSGAARPVMTWPNFDSGASTSQTVDESPVFHEMSKSSLNSEALASSDEAKSLGKSATSRAYKCHVCQQEFKFLSLLRNHAIEESHGVLKSTYKTDFPCRICQKSYSLFHSLQRHLRLIHNVEPEGDELQPKYQCELCERKYFSLHALMDHMNNHTKERPYQCDLCERNFSKHSGLNYHKKSVHFGIRPQKIFKCKVCDHASSTVSGIKYHMKARHNEMYVK